MNILISASTATQLSICLIFLLVIFVMEVGAFIGLFVWRKKALKSPKPATADSSVEPQAQQPQTETVAETQQPEVVAQQPAPQPEVVSEQPATEQTEPVVEQPTAEQTEPVVEQPVA
ncbi:MAG: hypothetical protein K2M75_03305, partial [Clostridia bacterium]|nr:hypothetical protein [Clostridia bacterium]